MQLKTANKEIRDILSETYDRCESLTLRLEKFVFFEQEDKKVEEIQRICRCAARKGVVRQPSECFHCIPGAREFVMQLQSRLLVNHSGGILENTGLCLHRFFGVPMILGSSLKGIARHIALDKVRQAVTVQDKSAVLRQMVLAFGWADHDWQAKNKLKSDLQDVAGEEWPEVWRDCALALIRERNLPLPKKHENTPWKALGNFCGTVAFLPAVANCQAEKDILEADLINCHHREYYQSAEAGKLALDIENPVPVFFPAVRAGLDFVFTLAPAPGAAAHSPDFAADLDFARDCLCCGLSEYGVGAKTNAGYGWFEENQASSDQLTKKRQGELEDREIASLPPEERAIKDFLDKLPPNDRDGALKGKISSIDQLSEEEQRILCRVIKRHFADMWKEDCTEAGKAKGPDDKKYGKAYKRVEKVRQVAAKLGEEMP